jgi:hypothetical protein
LDIIHRKQNPVKEKEAKNPDLIREELDRARAMAVRRTMNKMLLQDCKVAGNSDGDKQVSTSAKSAKQRRRAAAAKAKNTASACWG